MALRIGCHPALEAGAGQLPGRVEFVPGFADDTVGRVAAQAELNHRVHRGSPPGAIGQIGVRQQAEVERLGRAKSRRATPALERRDEGQRRVAFEQQGRVRQVGLKGNPEPARQARPLDAPAFRRVVDLAGPERGVSVHGLYRILLAVKDKRLVLRKQPAGCAARLLVEPDRQIEGLDEIREVDADAAGCLVPAQGIADAVAAAAQGQQQRVVVVGLPICRGGGVRRRRKGGAGQRQRDEGGKQGAPHHDVATAGKSCLAGPTAGPPLPRRSACRRSPASRGIRSAARRGAWLPARR